MKYPTHPTSRDALPSSKRHVTAHLHPPPPPQTSSHDDIDITKERYGHRPHSEHNQRSKAHSDRHGNICRHTPTRPCRRREKRHQPRSAKAARGRPRASTCPSVLPATTSNCPPPGWCSAEMSFSRFGSAGRRPRSTPGRRLGSCPAARAIVTRQECAKLARRHEGREDMSVTEGEKSSRHRRAGSGGSGAQAC